MKLQVSELARLTGVSVRTLHYYDTIGLLKPAEIDANNGYRFYDETSLEKLKQILYYRDLNFSLKEIPGLMKEKDATKKSKLLERRKLLQEKKKQVELLLSSIDNNLSTPTRISPWFDKILQDYNYSGFSYEAKKDSFFCAWGMADYENNKPFKLSSRFPVSILSGDFIVFCTLLFEDKGLLSTEDTIGTYVPECRYGREVKIRHLLDMTSGFSDELVEKWRTGQIAYSEDIFYKEKNLEELLEIIHYTPLKFTPGTEFDPCGLNDELLGIILERVGGAPLNCLLQRYIFEPLEMTNTSYEGSADIIGYTVSTPPKPIIWNYHHNNTSWGLLGTAEDLEKWFQALQNRKLLSSKGYEKLFSQTEEEFSCGIYKSRSPYRLESSRNNISFEVLFDFEKDGFRLHVRNKAPLPDNHDRLMYFTIPGCDDGQIKLEAWEMDTDTFVKITSIKIFDKEAKELYSFPHRSNKYLLFVENHGEKQHACEFLQDDSYYLALNFAELFGGRFDPTATYILEVRAECDSPNASQIGITYLRNNEKQYMGYYIFFNEIQPYELFMEALGNVTEVV